MNPEKFHPDMRERAIHPNELLLNNGAYANKMTLQDYARKAGLPVPKLLSYGEALDILTEGQRLEQHDIEAFYRNPLIDQFSVYARGYHKKPDEMWWVDVFPTTSITDPESLADLQSSMERTVANSDATRFVLNNFGPFELSDVSFFLQQGSPASIYFSTLSYGPHLFIAGNNDLGRGVNWSAWEGDTAVATYSWHFFPEINRAIRSLSTDASRLFQGAFAGSQRGFEYKHDILWSTKTNTLSLIQSRVSSRAVSEDEILAQNEAIVHYLESGVPVISLEPSGIGTLHKGRAPHTPFVLEFTNEEHMGLPSDDDYINIDLSNCVGLILPESLRGGLLHHGGYRIIAYALYWGLPISFSA